MYFTQITRAYGSSLSVNLSPDFNQRFPTR